MTFDMFPMSYPSFLAVLGGGEFRDESVCRVEGDEFLFEWAQGVQYLGVPVLASDELHLPATIFWNLVFVDCFDTRRAEGSGCWILLS